MPSYTNDVPWVYSAAVFAGFSGHAETRSKAWYNTNYLERNSRRIALEYVIRWLEGKHVVALGICVGLRRMR